MMTEETQDYQVLHGAAADAANVIEELGPIGVRMDGLADTARELATAIGQEMGRRGQPQSTRAQMQLALLNQWALACMQLVSEYLAKTVVQGSEIERLPKVQVIHRPDRGAVGLVRD